MNVATENILQQRDNRGAVKFMVIATLGYSFVPLLIALGGGVENPFLFNGCLTLGLVLSYLPYLLVKHRELLTSPRLLPLIRERIFPSGRVFSVSGLAMLLMIVNNFEFAVYAWSARFVDIALSAVLFETWPILLVLLTVWLYRTDIRRHIRYQSLNISLLTLMVVGFVGFVFVVLSQEGTLLGLGGIHLTNLIIGVVLAVIASGVTSLSAFGFRWGTDLSRDIQSSGLSLKDPNSLDLFGAVVGSIMANLIVIPLNFAVGFSFGERLPLHIIVIAVAAGAVSHGVATLCWRKSNLMTSNLGVNAIAYGTPILSLVWLFYFSQADVLRVDYLIIGTAAVLTANLLINVEAEMRWGFKALVLALGGCGAIVYLRDDAFSLLGVEEWYWGGSGYFESITLAATVFTLLLAFRVARLVGRTSEEDSRTFVIYRNLDMLARRGVVDPKVCDYILQIDQAENNSAAEHEAYGNARRLIAEVNPGPLNDADSQMLSVAEANLDALARSKQVDIHLGEVFALIIFASITVGLALFSLPPEVAGWTRLLVDLFAMIISAVMIFLLVHIQDLQKERDGRKLEKSGSGIEHRHYSARFVDISKHSFDQWVSITVGTAIVLTYASLLARKWLGWFG